MATVDLSLTGFDLTNPAKPVITHDPNAILDYTEDWTDWLSQGDTIVSATVTFKDPENTMTLDRAVAITTGNKVTAWITGGRLNTTENATYHIVTAEGREDDRTLYFKVKDR